MKNFNKNIFGSVAAITIFVFSIFLTGCGGNKQPAAPTKVQVKAMNVLQQSTPIVYGFPGQIQSTDEVQVRSKLSGEIVEKYVSGGEKVSAGQALFKVDPKQYETSLLSAQADLRKAEVNLRRAKDNLDRNERLYDAKAISEQTLMNSRADMDGYLAAVEAAQISIRKANENLDNIIVYSPMDGRAALDDVAVGTYATAGNTTLVTIGTIDPVLVKFDISETDYLNIIAHAITGNVKRSNFSMNIILSNGEQYPYQGNVVEADRALSKNSGSITVKAEFDNPDGILLPGMFAHVQIVKPSANNALLVPERAVQQLLDKTFVLIVGENNKSVSKIVELGEKVGSYYIVKSGLTASDKVIVEGLTNLQAGKDLVVTEVTAEEMGFSTKTSINLVNES